MLQQTAARLEGIENVQAPLVICNEAHRFMVAEQLRRAGTAPSAIILEPCGRNTAPAVALAAFHSSRDGDDPLLLVMPSDHLIKDLPPFRKAVQSGARLAAQGRLVTFGIVPDAPETGYGYIKAGDALEAEDKTGGESFEVASFVEKPDLATAEKYLADGDYYWNSGMFIFRASAFLGELGKFNPEMLQACRKAYDTLSESYDFLRLDDDTFAACPSDSIDYAVMEKTSLAAAIPLDAGWSDIGSWSALWETGARNSDGNAITGDVLTHEAKNNYLHASGRLLAVVGVENLVVVETADAVLVADRDRVQQVKAIVEQLNKGEREEALLHRRVNRPWGTYECVDAGEQFKVKRIVVDPGASLSLQLHRHRAEHWVVVRGTARVTCNGEVKTLTENQSTYIPLGVKHRLENPEQTPLEIIEIQSGDYLSEDDIERFLDNYAR